MTDIIADDFEQDLEPVYNPYYLLDDGRIYDKDKRVFVTAETDADFKAFKDAGNSPLSIGPNGYTLEQLKRSVLEFYGWPVGECLLSVDELKEKMLSALSAEADKFEQNLNKDMYFTSSLGFKVNGDRRTKDNLQDLISTFTARGSDTVAYRDYDNQTQNLTLEQLKVLLSEHLQNGFNLYEQKWAKQELINAAKTKKALGKISLTFAMMDFSGE